LSDTPLEATKQDPPQSGSGTAAHSTTTAPVAHSSHEAKASWWGSVWPRIKEHKVAQWTVAYAAFAFVALHVTTLLSDALEWPHAVVRAVTLVLIIGLPMTPILAWYHGVRALKRVSGSELIIIALLLVIGGSDRPLNDIFKVQSEVATAVAQRLETKLAGDESAKFEVGGTKNPDAYDAYLRAQRVRQENLGGPMNRAVVEAVDKAIALDPEYAAACAMRATALTLLSYEPKLRGAKALREQPIASAERAVALAPDLGDAHVALGNVRSWLLQDFVGAGVEFDRALALAPGSADVQRYAADYLAEMVHFEPAFVAVQRAVNLDPQGYRSYFQQAVVFYKARRYSEALAAARHAQALQPGSTDVGRMLSEFLFVSGQVDQARQLLETPTTTIGERDRVQILSMVYHALGRQADAEHELDQYKIIVGDDRPYRFATAYAQWGNAPAALRWLDRAVLAHDQYLSRLKVDPLLDPIRNEPQFKALVARMNFPP